jgi:hypothetical protein
MQTIHATETGLKILCGARITDSTELHKSIDLIKLLPDEFQMICQECKELVIKQMINENFQSAENKPCFSVKIC